MFFSVCLCVCVLLACCVCLFACLLARTLSCLFVCVCFFVCVCVLEFACCCSFVWFFSEPKPHVAFDTNLTSALVRRPTMVYVIVPLPMLRMLS